MYSAYILTQRLANLALTYCTCPRWPSSQDFVGGLLKQDNLCMYQACRTKSLAVQAATTAPSPAASMPSALRNREIMHCIGNMAAGATRCAVDPHACPVRPADSKWQYRNKPQLPASRSNPISCILVWCCNTLSATQPSSDDLVSQIYKYQFQRWGWWWFCF